MGCPLSKKKNKIGKKSQQKGKDSEILKIRSPEGQESIQLEAIPSKISVPEQESTTKIKGLQSDKIDLIDHSKIQDQKLEVLLNQLSTTNNINPELGEALQQLKN